MDLIKKRKNDNIKYQLVMLVEFYKNTAGGRKTIENWFNSGIFQLALKNYFDEELYSNLIQEIVRKIEEFTCQSSGWIVNKIMQF